MRRAIGLLLINAVFIFFMVLKAPVFVSGPNISVILSNMALESIALAGLTLLLVGGLFDLSVDGVVAASGVLCATIMTAGIAPVLAILASLCAGILVGWLNGFLVMHLKINALIATLGMWWMMSGVAFGLTRSITPYGFPDSFQILGQARVLGVRIYVWYAIVFLLISAVVLSYTKFGRHIYIMGGNKEAGRLFGIHIERTGVMLYVIMGFLAAFIGVVLCARLNAGAPNAVDGMTMRVIAAAVIGGCSLSGGRGTVLVGLLGLLLLTMLSNAATILGIDPYWQKLIVGIVLLSALVLDSAGSKIRIKRRNTK